MNTEFPHTAIAIRLTKFPNPVTELPVQSLPFEFHILKTVRDKYQFDQTLFSFTGNVIIPNFRAARIFAQTMNAHRDLKQFPGQTIKAGEINAMGLIDEINHYILRLYEETVNPGVFSRVLASLEKQHSRQSLDQMLLKFTDLVPPLDVYLGKISSAEFLQKQTEGKPHSEIAFEELLLFYISNLNLALEPFEELFDESDLLKQSDYLALISTVEDFFKTQKPFGPDNQFILDLLRAPMLASPFSLEGQLAFMKERWGMLLSEVFLERMASASDLIKEDNKIVFPGVGNAPTVVPTYPQSGVNDAGGNSVFDIERFTQDIDWMPKVVLLAKNAYVWLDQLSKQYGRPITRLDQIPDEEIDRLARWNFTGLWLIGIWERSPASRRIKQMTGNPEAVSSAYSIYDYTIAHDLGGEDSFNNLKERAWRRGIRLAGDMVPNHMGIYSRWMIEHPEFFIQSPYSPFPNYRFTGADLSEDPSVQIRIEDGYWSKTDAAVVFQRIDNRTGAVSYVYHGNDGTNMPWNDTAQLNYLRAEVREAVIQTIFHVARKCSIIRFDAAMTLAKKHFQRLWFPQPGTGGDIPSRADHAMTRETFDTVFPNEFWREVVDRINAEMPNTLLLAEAFWLLEGYFVRTLGMHRVYNSAFMHMMMKEENSKYREAIRNTLHYNPEILKRYVNFMSNPDEQTAIGQFGKDDKYFGVAVLMVTLPGLPMFAHGQIDGFTEKYGMEYKRAYYDEWPDEHLVKRHEREIFPLMNKRHLFSQVVNFELYDFMNSGGGINENVFVYSNMAGSERALICFHNTFEECKGRIKHSSGKTISTGEEGSIRSKTLGEALNLNSHENVFYIVKEHISQLEFLRSGMELHLDGMYFELKAFQYQVFHEFREVYDTSGEYAQLARFLQGRGVPDINEALKEMILIPVHQALSALIHQETVMELQKVSQSSINTATEKIFFEYISAKFKTLVQETARVFKSTHNQEIILRGFEDDLKILILILREVKPSVNENKQNASLLISQKHLPVVLMIIACRRLRLVMAPGDTVSMRTSLKLDTIFSGESNNFGIPFLVDIIVTYKEKLFDSKQPVPVRVVELLSMPDVREFVQVNRHQEVEYFNKERFEELLWWLYTFWIITGIQVEKVSPDDISSYYHRNAEEMETIKTFAGKAQYQLLEFTSILSNADTNTFSSMK